MDVVIDSRKVKAGDIFVCLQTDVEKAKNIIADAMFRGASEVYSGVDVAVPGVCFVESIWQKLGTLLKSVYNQKPKKIIAITGTNGKTSTAYIAHQILTLLGKNSVYVGTIGAFCNNQAINSEYFAEFLGDNLTTPDVATMHKILHLAGKYGDCEYAVFEASSHGIVQGRVDFLDINVAGFTNLTQDHLDYHGTMSDYFAAKLRLFTEFLSPAGVAVINGDDEKSKHIIEACFDKKVLQYGSNGDLKVTKTCLKNDQQSVNFSFLGLEYSFDTSILGGFQVYNIMCAIGCLVSVDVPISSILEVISSVTPPLGRLERVKFNGEYTNVYIDYAHTPDALEKALLELKKICEGRLIVVFGCGGDRDKSKRPKMGEVAAGIANFVIITDDNPRNEDPAEIRRDIISGIQHLKQEKINKLKHFPNKRIMLFAMESTAVAGNLIEINSNRKDAIEYAIDMMEPKDILLIAGKGHENYQIIGGVKKTFSDQDTVVNYFREVK